MLGMAVIFLLTGWLSLWSNFSWGLMVEGLDG